VGGAGEGRGREGEAGGAGEAFFEFSPEERKSKHTQHLAAQGEIPHPGKIPSPAWTPLDKVPSDAQTDISRQKVEKLFVLA